MRELDEDPLTRLHLFETPAGIVTIDYSAVVLGRAAPVAVHPTDPIVFLRPSRYVQSDTLTPFARETFAHRDTTAPGWCARSRAGCTTGWSTPPRRRRRPAERWRPWRPARGVCRDFAHLTAALLRALDVPARLVSVYAPQLVPMDFHAVVEALVDSGRVGRRRLHAARSAARHGAHGDRAAMRPTRRGSRTRCPTSSCSRLVVDATSRRDVRRRPRRAGRAQLAARSLLQSAERRGDQVGRVAGLGEVDRGGHQPVVRPGTRPPFRRRRSPGSTPRRRTSAPELPCEAAAFFSDSMDAASRCATETSIVSPLVWLLQRQAMPGLGLRGCGRRSCRGSPAGEQAEVGVERVHRVRRRSACCSRS